LEWCTQGISLDQIKMEIYQTTNEDDLKQLYNKHIDYRKEIYADIMKRKAELEPIHNVLNNQPIHI